MTKKRGKKERNDEKLKKMLQKDVQFDVCFQNRTFFWCARFIANNSGLS